MQRIGGVKVRVLPQEQRQQPQWLREVEAGRKARADAAARRRVSGDVRFYGVK